MVPSVKDLKRLGNTAQLPNKSADGGCNTLICVWTSS